MKRKIAAILIFAVTVSLMSGCVQAATTANTNVEVLEQAETASVFALSVAPTATPVITYVPEEIAELQAEAEAIAIPQEQEAQTGEGRGDKPSGEETPEPESTKEPEETKKPEATVKPEQTKKPEYTVKDVEDQQGYVYAKSVNLRSGPGTDYDIIREYDQYRELTVTGKSGDWYQVKVGSREGFMMKEYVKLGEVPKATPKPTPEPEAEDIPEIDAVPEATPEPTKAPSVNIPSSGSYTSRDLELLAKIVTKEANKSHLQGCIAVANVILNRINSSKFPNTVEDVVYQKNQFSTSGLDSKTPSSTAIEAVTAVFVNGQTVLPSNVYYFRTASSWSGHELYGEIGGNYFYY